MDAQTDVANPSVNKNKEENKEWKPYQERKKAEKSKREHGIRYSRKI